MSDLEDCARFLAKIAFDETDEALAITTVDDCVIKGISKVDLRRAFDRHNPPDTPVSRVIRAELDKSL